MILYFCSKFSKMVTIIKKGTSKITILKLLKKMNTGKGLDAFRFCGIIGIKDDALAIQKQLRNEWD